MVTPPSKHLLQLVIGLGIALFVLDLLLPLGVGIGVLYGMLVILSFLLPYRTGPILVAAVCSVLTLVGIVLGPSIEGVPTWMGLSNRAFSLTAIWVPLLFFLHRRRDEDILKQAHDDLEKRIDERTNELALANAALTEEIAERKDTERLLLKSQAILQASQRDLSRSREELRELAGLLLTAQEADRRRISRDLHDQVNQQLAMLSMDLRRLEKHLAVNPGQVQELTQSMNERLSNVSDDVRRMAYRFHPSILDDLGLVKAIGRLIDDFSTTTGIACSYVHQSPAAQLPAEIPICLYRVAQESLNNIARHAHATRVEVELICSVDSISLSLHDNGIGFDPDARRTAGGHLGLLSMKERVRLAKGALQVRSIASQGTSIQVDIPLAQDSSHVENTHPLGR
jgi:signal transduction histidine kinase